MLPWRGTTENGEATHTRAAGAGARAARRPPPTRAALSRRATFSGVRWDPCCQACRSRQASRRVSCLPATGSHGPVRERRHAARPSAPESAPLLPTSWAAALAASPKPRQCARSRARAAARGGPRRLFAAAAPRLAARRPRPEAPVDAARRLRPPARRAIGSTRRRGRDAARRAARRRRVRAPGERRARRAERPTPRCAGRRAGRFDSVRERGRGTRSRRRAASRTARRSISRWGCGAPRAASSAIAARAWAPEVRSHAAAPLSVAMRALERRTSGGTRVRPSWAGARDAVDVGVRRRAARPWRRCCCAGRGRGGAPPRRRRRDGRRGTRANASGRRLRCSFAREATARRRRGGARHRVPPPLRDHRRTAAVARRTVGAAGEAGPAAREAGSAASVAGGSRKARRTRGVLSPRPRRVARAADVGLRPIAGQGGRPAAVAQASNGRAPPRSRRASPAPRRRGGRPGRSRNTGEQRVMRARAADAAPSRRRGRRRRATAGGDGGRRARAAAQELRRRGRGRFAGAGGDGVGRRRLTRIRRQTPAGVGAARGAAPRGSRRAARAGAGARGVGTPREYGQRRARERRARGRARPPPETERGVGEDRAGSSGAAQNPTGGRAAGSGREEHARACGARVPEGDPHCAAGAARRSGRAAAASAALTEPRPDGGRRGGVGGADVGTAAMARTSGPWRRRRRRRDFFGEGAEGDSSPSAGGGRRPERRPARTPTARAAPRAARLRRRRARGRGTDASRVSRSAGARGRHDFGRLAWRAAPSSGPPLHRKTVNNGPLTRSGKHAKKKLVAARKERAENPANVSADVAGASRRHIACCGHRPRARQRGGWRPGVLHDQRSRAVRRRRRGPADGAQSWPPESSVVTRYMFSMRRRFAQGSTGAAAPLVCARRPPTTALAPLARARARRARARDLDDDQQLALRARFFSTSLGSAVLASAPHPGHFSSSTRRAVRRSPERGMNADGAVPRWRRRPSAATPRRRRR